ncbi:MAG TPA: response regulator [Marmoricola sp.]|nr:response regulator [Marmoricola sp.]
MAKIVVADDDVDVRMLVALKLKYSGHDVVEVGDGAAAVETCRSERPDLVVLDLMMPVMSGLEACRSIKADPELAGVPVVLLTARAQNTDVDAGLAVGADAYVTKPFSPKELAARVESLLEGSGR